MTVCRRPSAVCVTEIGRTKIKT
uniref:Uncharacterized protein n=1 Tax=Anguilla anguilla TaxID=7936 RepID=A0A0E9RT96_ANGAN